MEMKWTVLKFLVDDAESGLAMCAKFSWKS